MSNPENDGNGMPDAERRQAFAEAGLALGLDADTLRVIWSAPATAEPATRPRLSLLSDAEWQIVRPLLPENVLAASGASPRQMLDVMLWRARHRHAGWRSVPADLAPAPDMARQKWARWSAAGVLDDLLAALPGLNLSPERRQEFKAVGRMIARREARVAQ